MDKKQRTHIPQLDGLRGLAIILVLLVHHFNYPPLAPFFYFGFAGVDVFFVLSGFVISGILLDTKQLKGYYKTFLARRALRTLPLYYGVLTVFAFIAPHFGTTRWFSTYQIYFWTHTSNYLFLQKGFFLPLGHFWSLAMEEQFYLIWPLVILILKPKPLSYLCILLLITGIVLRLAFHNPYLSYGLPFAHLDGLLIGSLLALAIRKKKDKVFHSVDQLFFFSTALLVLCIAGNFLITGRHYLQMVNAFTLTIVALFFGSILILSLKYSLLSDLFSVRSLLFMGKYSYGVYIFDSLFYHFSNWAGADRLAPITKLFFNAGLLIPVIVTAYLSFNWYERYFLRLKPKYKYSNKADQSPLLVSEVVRK